LRFRKYSNASGPTKKKRSARVHEYNRAMPSSPFACTTARHRTFDTGKVTLHALEWGEASRAGLCLLHGGAAHAHWFDRVTGAFTDRFHVIALDQRGHGESAWPAPPAYATEDFVGDLIAVFDQLGWERTILVGHSMGGHNSMACSAWHPDRVRGLAVLDSRPAIPEERLGSLRARGQQRTRNPYPSREAAAAAFRLVPRETVADPELLRHLGETGVVEREGGWFYRFDPDANRLRGPADCWPLLPRIAAPTLYVKAELSPNLPPEHVARIQSLMPHAQVVQVPNSYHHVTLDAPDAVITALDHFLGSLST
jgi:pimeloyl-ACP methyl ester carboxylesterase